MTYSEVTARVAILIAGEPGEDDDATGTPWMRRMCRTAARRLDASGVGICVIDDGEVRGIAGASDPVSERLEELQFVMGEGPCLDAYGSRRPVQEPDLRSTSRWPGYTPAVLEHGVEAVFAFPLQIGAARLGVLDVYRTAAGPLSPETFAEALSFAELAVESLLDGQASAVAASDDLEPDLADALENRSELYQAQGMLMVDLGVPLAEAMARLRAHAFATGQRPGAVAHEIVAGRLVLDRDAPPAPSGPTGPTQ